MAFDFRPLVKIMDFVFGREFVNATFYRAPEQTIEWGDTDTSNPLDGYQPFVVTGDVVIHRVPLSQDNDQDPTGNRERDQLRIWVQDPNVLRTVVTTGSAGQLPPDRVRDDDTGKVYELRPAGDHRGTGRVATAIAVLIDDDVGVVP